MMSSPSELSFDIKPQIYSMLQKSLGDHTTEQTQKLEEFVARLEEERLKIDAFKRELPLCMQLLTNGKFAISYNWMHANFIKIMHQLYYIYITCKL